MKRVDEKEKLMHEQQVLDMQIEQTWDSIKNLEGKISLLEHHKHELEFELRQMKIRRKNMMNLDSAVMKSKLIFEK